MANFIPTYRYSDAIARLIVLALLSSLIATGWYSRVFYVYAAGVYYKAKVCDEVQCERVKEMADQIGDLPVVKGLPSAASHKS